MRVNKLPSPARLREIFDYDSETGLLTWRYRPDSPNWWNAKYAGTVAGTINARGYRKVYVDYIPYPAHRLVWAIYHGTEPVHCIDHINGNCSDNRIENLRDVPHKTNMRNMRLYSSNSTGVVGVSWSKALSKWQAHITVDGRTTVIGTFDSFDQAVEARRRASQLNGYHKNHGRAA